MLLSNTGGSTLLHYGSFLALAQPLDQVHISSTFKCKWLNLFLGVVLGLTAKSSVKSSHVPSIVYISIIAIQCVGFLVSALLISPAKVRRNDGCAIAHFKPSSWREELSALPKSIMAPGMLLTSLAIFSCQMPYSLAGSLNAFYFNARTRALTNVSPSRSTSGNDY
jgi:hypothetical protein